MKPVRLLNTSAYNDLIQGRHGFFLYNKNDRYIGKAIEKYGEYSEQELSLLAQLCGPGDVVFEVGSNIGAHTVALAKHVGTDGRIFAFEPQRLVFQTLCANIALNSLQNVGCFWSAMGEKKGEIAVPELDPERDGNFGGLSLLGDQDGDMVTCLTLDEFTNLPAVKLLKIDVEGMEADVLRGGDKFIRKFRPILYVENDRPNNSENLIRLVDRYGYRMYWHLPLLFNEYNFFSDMEDIYPGIGSINMLCIHRDSNIHISGENEITDFSYHPSMDF